MEDILEEGVVVMKNVWLLLLIRRHLEVSGVDGVDGVEQSNQMIDECW